MEAKWNQLVEDLAEGRLPFVEAMMSASKAMVQPGDYRAYINHHRSFTMLMSDPRILRRMHQELMAKLDELTEGKFDKRAEERAIRAKDGFRLFSKLADVHDQVYGESPSLLCGATFEECLEQYHRLMGHMETLWDDACRLYREGHFPL